MCSTPDFSMQSEMDSDPWRLHPVRRWSGSAKRSTALVAPIAVPNSLQGCLGAGGAGGKGWDPWEDRTQTCEEVLLS